MNEQHKTSFLTTMARLAETLETLDACHNAVAERQQATMNPRGNAELIAMLNEIAYVAQETANELATQEPVHALRLIKGSTRQADGDLGKQPGPGRPTDQRSERFVVLNGADTSPFYLVKRAGG
ncbi:MAG: hypothetical protein AAF125_00325 [Chloroflexota bacterium]